MVLGIYRCFNDKIRRLILVVAWSIFLDYATATDAIRLSQYSQTFVVTSRSDWDVVGKLEQQISLHGPYVVQGKKPLLCVPYFC